MMNALIIEDDTNMAIILRDWLEAMHFEVTVTNSMALAADIISNTPNLEVITVDLNLTDSLKDATIEKISEIRSKKPDALLLVISGVLTEKDAKIAINLGADACMEKHNIITEKTFTQKLWDVMDALVKTPSEYTKRQSLMTALASQVARRCNELGCSIGETKGAVQE